MATTTTKTIKTTIYIANPRYRKCVMEVMLLRTYHGTLSVLSICCSIYGSVYISMNNTECKILCFYLYCWRTSKNDVVNHE